jgi:hypothetical protein
MLRARSLLLVTCLVPFAALAACGDEIDVYTPTELGARLLAPADMGPGWTETQRDVFDTREPENPSIDPSLWCPDYPAGKSDQLTTLAGRAGADVELQFGDPQAAEQPTYGLRQQAWSNKDSQDYLRELADAVATCNGATWTDSSEGSSEGSEEGTAAEYRLSALSVPTVGDETVAALVTITLSADDGGPTMTIRQRMAAVRAGSIVMVLQEGDTVDAEAEPSTTDAEFATLVEQAARPFVELDGGTG